MLAVATFSSVRSANRSARVAERSLLAGQQPVLVPSREDDPIERLRFGDQQLVTVPGHGAAVEVGAEAIYLALALRNGGAGLAVIHGWRVQAGEPGGHSDRPAPDDFRRQGLDLYIPAGETGYWLGALRDPSEPAYEQIRDAIAAKELLQVDLMYGDHEGGQRTIARFALGPWPDEDEQVHGRRASVLKYWNVDRDDPR